MTRRLVDDLIDDAKQKLEDLRAAVHEQIGAAVEHQAASEEFTHEAQKITEREEPEP